jgi:hypothetical protein
MLIIKILISKAKGGQQGPLPGNVSVRDVCYSVKASYLLVTRQVI